MRSEVAHRGHLGVGDDDGDLGVTHGERRAALDAGRAVADHPVELLLELGHHPGDALLGERVLVARLRGRQD